MAPSSIHAPANPQRNQKNRAKPTNIFIATPAYKPQEHGSGAKSKQNCGLQIGGPAPKGRRSESQAASILSALTRSPACSFGLSDAKGLPVRPSVRRGHVPQAMESNAQALRRRRCDPRYQFLHALAHAGPIHSGLLMRPSLCLGAAGACPGPPAIAGPGHSAGE